MRKITLVTWSLRAIEENHVRKAISELLITAESHSLSYGHIKSLWDNDFTKAASCSWRREHDINVSISRIDSSPLERMATIARSVRNLACFASFHLAALVVASAFDFSPLILVFSLSFFTRKTAPTTRQLARRLDAWFFNLTWDRMLINLVSNPYHIPVACTVLEVHAEKAFSFRISNSKEVQFALNLYNF